LSRPAAPKVVAVVAVAAGALFKSASKRTPAVFAKAPGASRGHLRRVQKSKRIENIGSEAGKGNIGPRDVPIAQ
jgi:hypothetical protein